MFTWFLHSISHSLTHSISHSLSNTSFNTFHHSSPDTNHVTRYDTNPDTDPWPISSHPTLITQLHGYSEEVNLLVFIGSDSGRILPHKFYQATRVFVKNGSESCEKMQDGSPIIEFQLNQDTNMQAMLVFNIYLFIVYKIIAF